MKYFYRVYLLKRNSFFKVKFFLVERKEGNREGGSEFTV